MNKQFYVKYDIDAAKITAGPQAGMSGVDGWYPFLKAETDNPRQHFTFEFNAERGVVVQIPDSSRDIDPTYKEMRSEAYPKIGDQLDMLFHDIANNRLTERGDFYTALKAVKDTYPKP